MKKRALGKTILGTVGLFIFIGVITVIIFQFPHVNIANGIWQGNFDINGKGKHDFTALYMNGKMVGISHSARTIYQGQVSIANKQYDSTMDMYIVNKGRFDSVQLTGTLPSPIVIHSNYQSDNGQNQGQLHLSYQHSLFEQDASLAKLNGDWILYDVYNILKMKIKDGIVRGANTSGCAYEGKIQVIDPKYNAYDVQIVVSSCYDLDTHLKGMAYLSSSLAENDTFNIYTFDEENDWSMYLPIVRNDDTRLIDKNKTWGGPPGPPL